MKKFFLLMAVMVLISAPLLAAAQKAPAGACSRAGIAASGENNNQLSSFPKCISQIYIWSLGLAALLALLVAILGAYSYMTAAGNAERAQRGTEMIWGAIIGLALLFGAYILLNTINPDLVNFHIGSGTCIVNPNTASQKTVNVLNKEACILEGGTWYSVSESTPTPVIPPAGTNEPAPRE